MLMLAPSYRLSLLCALALTLSLAAVVGRAAAQGTESARISHASGKSFEATVEHLEWQLGGYGINVVSRTDFRSVLVGLGIAARPSLRLEVMRGNWLKTVVEHDASAALELPLRIHVYERDDGDTTVSYNQPSATFGSYGKDVLTEMGHELDATLERVVLAATK